MNMKGNMDVQDGENVELFRLAKLPLLAREGERIPYLLA